ncbi:hypothetical protein EL17_16840 [Anditalea andensis]|uniref:Uncharacterized protein n=1 Tax=Anditalea andensis TaxID=1048983 RepID=A0A074KVW7_9BACT|nr:hypothetical protein EL17_16840 [Anditalea andensis]
MTVIYDMEYYRIEINFKPDAVISGIIKRGGFDYQSKSIIQNEWFLILEDGDKFKNSTKPYMVNIFTYGYKSYFYLLNQINQF